MQIIKIGYNDIDQRLDSFLKKTFPKLSLNTLYKGIRTKRIKINNKKTNINYRLLLNDVIQLYINDDLLSREANSQDFLLAPNKVDVIYEDDNVLLANKPNGLISHSDISNSPDTLINRIKHYLYDKKAFDYQNENQFAPSLANRLDRNTNGIVIVAKNARALATLNQKIKNHEIEKYYLTKVHGKLVPHQATLIAYLTKIDNNLVQISNKPIRHDSKKIVTQYKVLKYQNDISQLEIKLITGRTHQIRAHLAYIGHPLIGEKKYTTPKYSKLHPNIHQDLTAYKITFNFHPTGSNLDYLAQKTFKI
jgi:23S rRNA pseudouridine955/2504/2580 synthase